MASPILILQAVSFLDMLSAGLLMPQLPNHARQLGCNHILIGTMGALYSAFQLISSPITGSLSDVKGRKPMLLLSLWVCAFAYVWLGITSSIVVFLALRALLGTAKQTQLLTNALTSDYFKDGGKQSVVYGRIASLSGVGMSIGPIIGGHIIEAYPDYGFTIITFISGSIFALNSVLVRTLPNISNEKDEKQSKEIAIAPKLIDSIAQTLKRSIEEFNKIDWAIYWDVFLFKLLITLCMGLYYNSFALFLRTQHNVTPKNLGYIIAFQGAIGSMCTYFIRYITKYYKEDKDFSKRIYHLFLILTVTLTGMVTAPNVTVYIVLLIPFALCGSVDRVVTLEMITSRSESSNRGTIIGASDSVMSLSGVVTPLLSGVIGQYLGILYVLCSAAIFAGAGIIVSYRVRLQRSKIKTQ